MKYKIRDYYSVDAGQNIGMSYRSFENMDDWGTHWHDCCEIELVISGKGIHWLNGKEYEFSKGELFILTPLDCHSLIFDEPVNLVNIMFEDTYISREIYEKLLVRKSMGFENRVQLSSERHETVKSLFSVLYGEYERSEGNKDEMFSAFASRLIDGILIELLRELEIYEGEKVSDAPDIIGQAILYIHRHYRERISLSDVAADVHLSAGYFSTLFKQATGQNYKSYLNDLRMKNACRMLAKPELSVTEICFACGFDSFSNFMRRFKARHGVSPLKYRQTAKSEKTI